jgi:hypothetical protein
MTRPPRIPADSPGGALLAWLRAEFELSPAEDELARGAAGCLDHVAQLRELLEADGLIALGSKGQPRAHPALGEVRAELLLYTRLIHDLALPADAEPAALRMVQ